MFRNRVTLALTCMTILYSVSCKKKPMDTERAESVTGHYTSTLVRDNIVTLSQRIAAAVPSTNASESTLRTIEANLTTILQTLSQGPTGNSCEGLLARYRPQWSVSDLQETCRNANANCVISAASANPNLNKYFINEVCRAPEAACAGTLLRYYPSWNTSDFFEACRNTQLECVTELVAARQSPQINKYDINEVCSSPEAKCAGALAKFRMDWGKDILRDTCRGTKPDCVVQLAESRRDLGRDALNSACR